MNELSAARKLSELVLAQRDEGGPSLSDDEIRDFVAWVLLETARSQPLPSSPLVQTALGGLSDRALVQPDDDAATVREKIASYWTANPVRDDLRVLFQQALQELTAAGASEAGASMLLALGQSVDKRPLDDGKPRPEGTVPGGLAGLLALRTTKTEPNES